MSNKLEMQQQHNQPSVVKSIFFRGTIHPGPGGGALEVTIDQDDANLSIGRWRFCLDSLVFAPLTALENAAVAVAISTNEQLLHVPVRGNSRAHVPAPSRIALTVLNCTVEVATIIPTNKRWIEMSRPSNTFKLYIGGAFDDVPLHGALSGLIMLERVAHS